MTSRKFFGERTRLACWRWRLAIADFFFEIDEQGKVRFGETPKPAREARALPKP